MKLPRKTFEYIDASLITASPTKLRIEWYLSFTDVCIFLVSFVFWNSPDWMYYADIPYLQLVLGTILAGVALNVLWIVLVIERYFIKKIRVKKYTLELVASFVALPFEFFVINVLVDYITNFRPISFILQGITAAFIIISLLLLSLWSAFSLERWHAVKRKLSGEDDEIWIEEWVEEYEDEDEDEDKDEDEDVDEDEYVKEKDVKVIDYST